jgi:hypothetical protein
MRPTGPPRRPLTAAAAIAADAGLRAGTASRLAGLAASRVTDEEAGALAAWEPAS